MQAQTQTPEQAQTQAQTQNKLQLPDEIVEMFEYEITSGRYRKCVDSDFVAIVSALALSVDDYYDYAIRRVGDWYVVHIWVPGSGDDFAMLLRIIEDEIEECIVIDANL